MENKTKLDDEKSNRGVVLNTQQFGRLNKRKHGHLEKENQNNPDENKSNAGESQSPKQGSSKNKFKKKRNKKNSLQKKNNTLKYEQNKPTLLQKVFIKKNNRKIKYKEEFLFILKNLVAS